jgi:hypothetical protein
VLPEEEEEEEEEEGGGGGGGGGWTKLGMILNRNQKEFEPQ